MLTYDVKLAGDTPLYYYLYRRIQADILSGRLKDGEQLPSKRALAEHLRVAVITVATAYDMLVTEGYALARERSGYYVHVPRHTTALQEQHLPSPYMPIPEETPEALYPIDFKANRISLSLFPRTTWNRLLRQTICEDADSLFTTIPFNGLYALRCAIAGYLERNRGMHIYPAQIIIGAGTEYLYGRLTQMFGRGSVFGFEEPGYRRLSQIASGYGNECRFIPVDGEGLITDVLIRSDINVLHVSPANHFPSGIAMSAPRREALLDWVVQSPEHYIIEDDYDSEFRYKGRYISPVFTQDRSGKVIYMNTFSKTMVPSLRISYMVLPAGLLERYKQTMSFYSCTVSSFEQHALADFISHGYFERHINRLKTYYGRIRKSMLQALKSSRLSAISEVIEHNCGTHFLLVVRTCLTKEAAHEAGREAGIRLMLYSDYGYHSPQPGRRILVINYAGILPEQTIDVIRRLEQVFPECRDIAPTG